MLELVENSGFTADDAEMGYLNAAETLAFLLFGLPAGAWLDRMSKRKVMIATDFLRAAAVLFIPMLAYFGLLQVCHLIAVGLVVGVGWVFFDVGYQSYVPVIVDDEQIGEANGVLEATSQTMRLGGPAVAGMPMTILTAPYLLLANVVGLLCSALALIFIRDNEVVKAKDQRGKLLAEIGEGLRFVIGHDLLRRLVGTLAFINLGTTMVFTLLPLMVLRILGINATLYGIILSLGAVGGLLGSLFATRISRALGEGPSMTSSLVFSVLGMALFPLAVAFPAIAPILLIAGQMISGFAVLVFNIVQVTARQRLCPRHLLGRMNASIRTVVWGVMPIAAVLAGWLGTLVGTVPAIWAGSALTLISVLPMIFSPYRTMAKLPSREQA